MNYEWVQPTLERISDLLRMPAEHNSYGSAKVEPRLAWESLRLVWLSANACTPAPRVHPTKWGGLSFTWAGTDSQVTMVAEPGHQIQVTTSGNFLPELADGRQVLEAVFRRIERELGMACPEAVQT